jgi:phospholipid-binding lipoprotein MlaA
MRLVLMLAAGLAAGCAHTPPYEPADPLERVNRAVFKFNQTADKYVVRPVASAYVEVTPSPLRRGIGNFFSNLTYPIVILNDVLQGKFRQGAQDTGRLVLNSTAGLLGFFDVATRAGWERNDEDFGQTLGRWGVGPGWYLMLPLLGPSNNRDFVGRFADAYTGDPRRYMDTLPAYGLAAGEAVHIRSELLRSDQFLEQQLDPYVALRTAYLENRLNRVFDGNPPLDYGDDWEDDWEDD